VSFYVSTATFFFLLHCDEWDRVVALPRHKFVTGITLLQLGLHWPTVDEGLDTAALTSVSLMLLGRRNATMGGSGYNLASISLFLKISFQ
jgi:hypothetical protein